MFSKLTYVRLQVARERAQRESSRGNSPAPRSPGGRFSRRAKSPKGEAALLDALLDRERARSPPRYVIYVYTHTYVCIHRSR